MADPADQTVDVSAFDTARARADGMSDRVIAEFLAPKVGFDLERARKDGLDDASIVNFLAPPKKAEGAPAREAGEEPKPAPKPSSLMGGIGKAVGQEVASWPGRMTEAYGGLVTGAAVASRAYQERPLKDLEEQARIAQRIDEGARVSSRKSEDPDVLALAGAGMKFAREYQALSPEQRIERRKGLDAEIAAVPPIDETPGGRIAGAFQKEVGPAIRAVGKSDVGAAEKAFPLTEEEQGRSSVIVARTLAGLVPYVGSAVAGGLPALLGYTGVDAYGKTFTEAKEKGASDQDATGAAIIAGVVQGGLNAVPPLQALHVMKTIPNAFKGEFIKTMAGVAASAGTLLTFSQISLIADNAIAKDTFDPKRDLMQGVGEHMGETALAGALLPLGGAAVAAGANRFRRKTPEEVAKPIIDAPDIDTAITRAREVVEGTPADVKAGLEAAQLIGDEAQQQQAKLNSAFQGMDGRTVIQADDGTYHLRLDGGQRATGLGGEDTTTTTPITMWNPTDAPAKGAGPTISAEQVAAQRDVLARLGIEVIHYADDPSLPDGMVHEGVDKNTIFLSNNPQRNAVQVFAHELTHILEQTKTADGTRLVDVLHEQVKNGLTNQGWRDAARLFGKTAPDRRAFPDTPEGVADHTDAIIRHLVTEVAADMGGEAPKFPSFITKVVEAVEAKHGPEAAKGVLRDLIDGFRAAMIRLQEMFAKAGKVTEWQHQVTNFGEIHDTLAKMYAEKFGTPAEKENVALQKMRDRAARDRAVRGEPAVGTLELPPTAPEGFTAPDPAPKGLPPPAAGYQEAAQRVSQYRRWIAQLDDQRRQAAPDSPQVKLLQQTEAAILGKVPAESRLTKVAAAKLAQVRAQLDGLLNPVGDTPDMARLRQAMTAEQQKMADAAAVGTGAAPGTARAGAPATATAPSGTPAVRGRAVMPEPALAEIPIAAPEAPTAGAQFSLKPDTKQPWEMTAKEFDEAAARGKMRTDAHDDRANLAAVLKGDKPATDLDIRPGHPLGDAYESGALSERIKASGAFAIDDRHGRVIVGHTEADAKRLQKALDQVADENAPPPIDMGLAYGYSPADVAHFLKKSGWSHADLVKEAREQGLLADSDAKPDEPKFSPKQTTTPEFRRWFGDSKVVDEEGRPRPLYHGTTEDIEAFRAPAFFTEDPRESQFYSMDRHGNDGGRTYPVYVSIKNPLDARTREGSEEFISLAERAGVRLETDIHDNEGAWNFQSEDIRTKTPYGGTNVNDLMYLPEVREQMRKEGYDGLRAWDGGGMDFETPIWVPLEPTQIKSATGNAGTFDPGNPDIRFSPKAAAESDNQPGVVVGGIPGRMEWSYADPAAVPPPIQHPTQRGPRIEKIGAAVHKILRAKGFRDLAREVTGAEDIEVMPGLGTWEGNREPSFTITGKGLTDDGADRLARLLGFAFGQDSVITLRHSPDLQEGRPTLYIGGEKKLNADTLNAIISAARERGLDLSTSADGTSVKFIHFGDEAEVGGFMDAVGEIASDVGLPPPSAFRTRSDLHEASTYGFEQVRGDGEGQGLPSVDARRSDLLQRTFDHLVTPFARAVGAEGYRLSPDRFGERFGLAEGETELLREKLRPTTGVTRSTVPLVTGAEKAEVVPTSVVRTKGGGQRLEPNVTDAMWFLQNRAAQKGIIEPGDYTPKAKRILAQTIVDEIKHHIDTASKSAVGWYDAALKKAKAEYEKVFPQIKSDPDKAMLFDAVLGITSQGNDVHSNSLFATRIFKLLEDGRPDGNHAPMALSEIVDALKGTFGNQTRAIELNLLKLEHLIETNGYDRMRQLFNETLTVAEWNKRLREDSSLFGPNGKPLQVEGAAPQKVTGWMVFGPKIGSFINNLHGDYSTLTADLWFSRTWNRMLGFMFQHVPEKEAAQYQEFKDALIAEWSGDKGTKMSRGKPVMQKGKEVPWEHGTDVTGMSKADVDRLINDPQAMLDYAISVEESYRTGQYKEKSDLRRRAKNWIESRYEPQAAPRTDLERHFQQQTMEVAQAALKKQGVDITIADMQAALWYYEKELFGKLGVNDGRRAPADYADAAQATLKAYHDGDLFGRKAKVKKGAAKDDAPQYADYIGGAKDAFYTPDGDGGPRFSPKSEEPFYSALTRGVEGLKLDKATPGQWEATVRNMPGVKAEERAWVGLDDWLKLQTRSVTKAEVLDYLRANEIQVKEVMKGKDSSDNALREEARRALQQEGIATPSIEQMDAYIAENGYEMDAVDMRGGTAAGAPKFASYVLPGGENYRELLLTLPPKKEGVSLPEGVRFKRDPDAGPDGEMAWTVYTRDGENIMEEVNGRTEAEARANATRLYQTYTDNSGQPLDRANFRGGHWDEPNVLAHIRFDDRTGPNGEKVLHIAEIQSDWHQKGRKQGYSGVNAVPLFDVYSDGRVVASDLNEAQADAWQAAHPEQGPFEVMEHEFGAVAGGVPDAPFKTTWPELAMKRMLRYAAENGYDRVSWDTGETNAARFDLSKQVEAVRVSRNSDGTFMLSMKPVGARTFEGASARLDAQGLADHVGKDLAEKIVTDADKTEGAFEKAYSGLDLKVGGEGMAAFYDKQLPVIANKLGKKFGAKVEAGEVPAGNPEGWHLTPPSGTVLGKWMLKTNNYNTKGIYFETEAEAQKALAEKMGTAPSHSIAITDAMREGVMRGQPLFSPKSPEFKRWFGDSKIVEDDGSPRVVYKAMQGTIPNMQPDTGMTHLALDPVVAEEFAGGGTRSRAVQEVYVKAENPFDYRNKADLAWLTKEMVKPENLALFNKQTKAIMGEHYDHEVDEGLMRAALRDGAYQMYEVRVVSDLIKARGHDAIYMTEDWQNDNAPNLAVFSPTQIKSATDNTGAYDPANPDIRYSPKAGKNPNRKYTAAQDQLREDVLGDNKVDLGAMVAEFKKGLGKKVVREIFDPFVGVKEADPKGYVGLRIANSNAGAVEMFNTWGTLKIDDQSYRMDKETGGVINGLVKPLADLGEAGDFILWVAGNRAERLMKEDRERLFTPASIAAAKTLNQGKLEGAWTLRNGKTTTSREAAYLDALARLDEANQNALDIAVSSGLLKRSDVDALWKDPFYVPFYRVAEGENTRSFSGPGAGFVKQEAFKALKGGTEKLRNNLWENAFGNWSHMIDAALRNKAASDVLQTAVAAGGAKKMTLQEFRYLSDKQAKAETTWVMENGEKQYYRVTDPSILTAVTALDYVQSSLPLMGLGRAAKKALQMGTAMNPIFQVKSLVRDTTNSLAVSPISRNFIKNLYTGFAAQDVGGTLKNVALAVLAQEGKPESISRQTADAIAGGGVLRFASLNDSGVMESKVSNYLDTPEMLKKFGQFFSRAGRAYADTMGLGEGVTRLALYDQMIKEGASHSAASFATRDLNDITLKGASPLIRTLLELKPFTGSWLQGLYKAGRAASESDKSVALAVGSKIAQRTAWRFTQGIIALAALNLALDELYKDDPDYQNRNEYDRNSNFWFKFLGTEYRIPMGFEVASLARMLAISVQLTYDKEMPFERWSKNMRSIVTTNMMLDPTPQILAPLYEVATNKSRTGTPIVGRGLEKLRSDEQYTINSTMPARGISSALSAMARGIAGPGAQSLSPIQIDYLARAYGGWVGATAMRIADVALRSASNEPERPASDAASFWTQGMISNERTSESVSGRYVNMLYDQAEGIERAYATYRDMLNAGRGADAREFLEDNRELLTRRGAVKGTVDLEGRINRQIRLIANSPDPDMTAEQKRIQIMRLTAMKNQAAERAMGVK